jgi:hypothetical protein
MTACPLPKGIRCEQSWSLGLVSVAPRSRGNMAVTRIAPAKRSDVSAPLLRVLFLPAPKSALVQDGHARPVQAGQLPDVVVLTETNSALLLSERLTPGELAILPVIDASPTSGHAAGLNAKRADVSVPCTPAGMQDALAMTLPMVERARRLPARLVNSHAPERLLLARLGRTFSWLKISSSAIAKCADALRRISLACRNSRFSRAGMETGVVFRPQINEASLGSAASSRL